MVGGQSSEVRDKKSAGASDYSLYKCQGCGQMVMGFDRESHVERLHGGESQGFVRL